jgi:hypothetical protein
MVPAAASSGDLHSTPFRRAASDRAPVSFPAAEGFNPGLSSSLLPTDILSVPVLLAPLAMPSRLVTLLLGGGTTRRGVAAGTCRFGTR